MNGTDGTDRAGGNRLRVLYVEDDTDNLHVARLHLAEHCEVLHARTDVEACELLMREGARLDVALLDVELKGSTLDGIELAKVIRGNLPRMLLPAFARAVPVLKLPLIFLTAHGVRVPEEVMRSSGADWLLGKPVDFSRLRMALSTIRLDSTLSSFRRAIKP